MALVHWQSGQTWFLILNSIGILSEFNSWWVMWEDTCPNLQCQLKTEIQTPIKAKEVSCWNGCKKQYNLSLL